MKPQITFFLPDEKLVYHIKNSYGKILYQKERNVLFYEVESTDDLYHVEEDSLQNSYPEVVLNIEDFPVSCALLEELLNQELSIPQSMGEIQNEEGETEEVFYTNLNLNDTLDLETNDNKIKFLTDDQGDLCILWKGNCIHFENEEEKIRFELYSKVNFGKEPRFYDDI